MCELENQLKSEVNSLKMELKVKDKDISFSQNKNEDLMLELERQRRMAKEEDDQTKILLDENRKLERNMIEVRVSNVSHENE